MLVCVVCGLLSSAANNLHPLFKHWLSKETTADQTHETTHTRSFRLGWESLHIGSRVLLECLVDIGYPFISCPLCIAQSILKSSHQVGLKRVLESFTSVQEKKFPGHFSALDSRLFTRTLSGKKIKLTAATIVHAICDRKTLPKW